MGQCIADAGYSPGMGDVRHLVLVLGDQLDRNAAAFDGFDADRDLVWMAENEAEATHVWCQQLRLVFFFSAMRHFRDDLTSRGRRVEYHELQPDKRTDSGRDFGEILTASCRRLKPQKLIMTRAGDDRVQKMIEATADDLEIELDVRPDTHFYITEEEFSGENGWATGRKSLVMETFYRWMRKKHTVMLTKDGAPLGGSWNYDADNRESFGNDGPPDIKAPRRFSIDDTTRAVIAMVEQRYPDHPGPDDLAAAFDYPVTRKQSRAALRDFIKHRLPKFGTYQDAMWAAPEDGLFTDDHAYLYHSRLSAVMNVKLLNPREVVEAAISALEDGDAPLNSVEGFVRQIIGWREFVRGIYWMHMPGYAGRNALGCDTQRDVPRSYWDGQTDMNCIRSTMQSVLEHGYAHHIQRLMILGLFAQLYGVHPRKFHDWHMAMYLDAIDWVSLPNALGMSQYGDGGIMGTKPYCASGNYINRMSNYCRGCRYRYDDATGDDACPVTVFYWDFLDRYADEFADNRRMLFQLRNLERKSDADRQAIGRKARAYRKVLDSGGDERL